MFYLKAYKVVRKLLPGEVVVNPTWYPGVPTAPLMTSPNHVISGGPYWVSVLGIQENCVRYEPGKWAKAPRRNARRGFHLTAFSDLESAVEFLKEWVLGEVWEVWESDADQWVDVIPIVSPPVGTVMFKKIRIRRPIVTTDAETYGRDRNGRILYRVKN